MRTKTSRLRTFRPAVEQLEERQLLALTIVPTFDATIKADPKAATIENTINTAIAAYKSIFSDAVTVKITFKEVTTGLGSNLTSFTTTTYSAFRAALASHAKSADDTTALASLPTGTTNPVNNGTSMSLTTSLARALGLSKTAPASDSTVSLNTSMCNLDRTSVQDPNKADLLAVTWHEIDEVLAGGSGLDTHFNGDSTAGLTVEPLDFYRYSAPGVRSFDTNAATTSYFSIDGGTTNLVGFNQYSPASGAADFGDWFSGNAGQGAVVPRVQDAFVTPGKLNLGVELRRLDVLGYTLGSLSVSLDASNNLVIQDASTGGTNDALTIQADTANAQYIVSDPALGAPFTLVGTVPNASISADGHTAYVPFATVTGTKISVNTLAGDDSLTIDISLGTFPKPIAFNGGAGTNTLIGPNVALAWNATVTWNISGANAGSVANVTFVNTQYLTGSSARDVFHFSAAGTVAGRINGGAGSNWLDYSGIVSGVAVNLAAGTAARATGGVVNVNNVLGSATGSDHLIGNSAGGVLVGHGKANTIIAGSGRSILIGGFGVNTIIGDAGDDLIINGRTSYDSDFFKLEAILATWQGAQTFPQRIAALQAVGPDQLKVGATVFLAPSRTVGGVGPRFGNGPFVYASTLRGNGGSDWFFTALLVSVIDRTSGETVTT